VTEEEDSAIYTDSEDVIEAPANSVNINGILFTGVVAATMIILNSLD